MAAADVELMLRARDGDASVFEELYCRYHASIVHFFRQRLRLEEVAEDLAQEVFVRLWLRRAKYVPLASFSTYLFRVAENLAIDEHRRLTSRPHVRNQGTEEELLDLADETSRPDRVLWQRLRRHEVRQAIARLSPGLREVFVRCHFAGESYATIGAALNIPLGTVKYRMWEAVRQLRRQLSHLESEETP